MLALRPATTKERVQKLQDQPEPDQEKATQSQSWAGSAHIPVSVSMNILPCRIHHDGPVEVSKRYWNPVNDGGADNKQPVSTAYFRGRKLRGRSVPVPDGYHGVVVTKLPEVETVCKRVVGHENEDEEDNEEPLLQLETVGRFPAFTVWEHEKLPTDDDLYVRSMEEWVSFAHSIHDDRAGPTQLKN
ncbi:ribonuclease H2 subunit C [Trichophyton mentagrophytes]|nr:ribonuclease H2 subunit C [Trichophyton mentagrophytes]